MGSVSTATRTTPKIRIVNESEFPSLQKGLERTWPKSNQVFNIFKLKVSHRLTDATPTDFYVFEDGEKNPWEDPFILCVQLNTHSTYCILLHSPSTLTQGMKDAFEGFVKWEKSPLFSAIPQPFYKSCLRDLCLKYGRLRDGLEGVPCDSHMMDRDLALTYEKEYSFTHSDQNVYLVTSLTEANIDQMLDNYGEWKQPQTKEQLKLYFKHLASTGIFQVSKMESSGSEEPAKKELASFAVLTAVGLCNILHTEVSFRRKGLGQRVLESLGRKAAEMGLYANAECLIYNDASRQVQLKAGFKFVQNTNWVRFQYGHE